jgi:putative membrane protein
MVTQILSYWLLQAIAMVITAALIPGLTIRGISGAFGIVAALALVNATLWDAALFFQVPDHISSQVLLLLLANGVLFWVLVKLLPGIEVEGVLPALVAPLVFTLLSLIISYYGRDIDWAAVWESTANVIEGLRDHFLSGEVTREKQPV